MGCLREVSPKFTTTAREFRFQAAHASFLTNIEEVSFSVRKSIPSKTSIVPSSCDAAVLEWNWGLEAEILGSESKEMGEKNWLE